MHAARNGRVEMVETLLDLRANTALKAADGTTAAHMAAVEGKKDLLKRLLEGNHLHQEGDQRKWTPIFYACREGHGDAVEFLLSIGSRPNERDADGRRPLMIAAEGGHGKVAQILLRKGCTVDDKDDEDRTALLYAIMNGHEQVAIFLLKHDANPFVKSKKEESPGPIALEQGMTAFRGLLRGREDGFN